ncbi:hypothetical protein [Mucilaginibacter defluvii]|uniref:Uncharacterized protein n=1 Tax=Mucilaginibacter defluvii TaxID=1196019 RepID=A0ABP9FL64_9SPHI
MRGNTNFAALFIRFRWEKDTYQLKTFNGDRIQLTRDPLAIAADSPQRSEDLQRKAWAAGNGTREPLNGDALY